ncbi:MAG TPA: hypothetical protein DCM27_04530 [Rhodospirillaceae bacterium]|nr:hypothetical protein [Rhodospirillaceae bacterium]
MKIRILLAALVVFSSISGASAQPVIDASRVEDQLNLPQATPDIAAPPVRPPLPSAPVPQGAETVRFFLKAVTIDGARIYPPSVWDELLADMKNRDVSVADLYRLAGQITNRYRADGYVMAQAFLPPQTLKDGVARILVIEPFIDEVKTEGAVPQGFIVQKTLAPWYRHKILNVGDLETTLLRINDLPGVHVQSVIEPQPGHPTPGALALRLIFTKTPPLSGEVSFDNFGSKYIGPFQGGARLTMDNLFGHMAETTLQIFTPTQMRELLYGNITHHIPALWSGFTFDLAANYSRVVPGYTLSVNDVKSQSRTFSAGVTQSIIRSRSTNLAVSASLESRDSTTKTLGTKLSEDKLTVAMVETAYETADGWSGLNAANIKLRQGMNIMGARKTGSAGLSRLEGESDFTSLQFQVSRLQKITQEWSLYTNLRGQYAPQPLLSSEEFGYGGNPTGRAYNASEIVGDRGLAGTIEARYALTATPQLNLNPYAFYDIGKVWNIDKIDGSDFSGASAGFGIKGALRNGIAFDTYIAQPLTRRIETPQYGSGHSPVFKFSLEYHF